MYVPSATPCNDDDNNGDDVDEVVVFLFLL